MDIRHRRIGKLMRQNGISVVRTRGRWLYIAVILDLHSRRGIGWAVSNRMKRDLAIRALSVAIVFRQPPEGCIYYLAGDFEVICRESIIRTVGRNTVRTTIRKSCASTDGFKVSVSGKGNCYDNSAVETFFKTINTEMVIFAYINCFYNPHRRHLVLGWKSPAAFERKMT